MPVKGSTWAWRKLRARVIREEPLCWLQLPGCTRRSDTADHIIPVSIRPDLDLVRANLHGACHHCNRKRSNASVGDVRPAHNTAAQGFFNTQAG